MKNLILILFIALVSCSGSDDNNTTSVNIDENLVGKWSLINYGEWPAGNFAYNNNEIIWEFHQNGDLSVTVEEQTWVYPRSEEHTSELQSRENLVCRLLLEKKNEVGVRPAQHYHNTMSF